MEIYICKSDCLAGFIKNRLYFGLDKADGQILLKNDRGQAVWKNEEYFEKQYKADEI